MLVSVIMLTAFAVVREREIGTLEQLMKHQDRSTKTPARPGRPTLCSRTPGEKKVELLRLTNKPHTTTAITPEPFTASPVEVGSVWHDQR